MSKERTEERRNRFNGESVMLIKEEATKHDRIFINEMQATLEDKIYGYGSSKLWDKVCLLYTSPSPRDRQKSRMPSSA